jgi:hypothetical protein
MAKKRVIWIIFSLSFFTLMLYAEQESKLIYRWTFDESSRFSKKMEIVEGNMLKFVHHASSSPQGVYSTVAVGIELPLFFIFRVNLAGQQVQQGYFTVLLGGETTSQRYTWQMKLPDDNTGSRTIDLLCQSYPGSKFTRFYLNPSSPALEGELLIKSIEILELSTPQGYPPLNGFYQILRNPGFEETWPYPGNHNTSWYFRGEVIHVADQKQAAKGQRMIQVKTGDLSQSAIKVTYPYVYLITFFARVTDKLSLIIRENTGATMNLFNIQPQENLADAERWQSFKIEYPVLQEDTNQVTMRFSGKDFSLDEVEMYPVNPNTDILMKVIDNTRKELQTLLKKNPDRFQSETKEFQNLTMSFENNELIPDEYLRYLEELLTRVKIIQIFE